MSETDNSRPRPESTYRLQFHKGFTFRDATAIVPYLASLGVTHAYASPYLKARPGSTHGYDVIDHGSLNPELGTSEDYDVWVAELRRHGMSHILDTVPNHVGVATNDNVWWNDVLENGRASIYGDYFDITWEGSPVPSLNNKVLLPLLGDAYGAVLEKGELKLSFENGAFFVSYHDRRFPISPRTYGQILSPHKDELHKQLSEGCPPIEEYGNLLAAAARLPDSVTDDLAAKEERHRDKEFIKQHLARLASACKPVQELIDRNLAELNGKPGDARSFDQLDDLLNAQNYRLAFWRVAPDEINYRRFFDINDLAALKMENPRVFEATHKFIFDLIAQGKLAGLRIDHPDGLYDPLQYLQRLQEHFGGVTPGQRPPLHVTVEKILEADEPLPDEWPVDGTTGYDFLNKVNGLYVDTSSEAPLTQFYRDFTGDVEPFEDTVYEKKLLILDTSLSSELEMLTRLLDEIAQGNRRSRDFTHRGLREALRQVVACFPVYRSYIANGKVRDADRPFIDTATQRATEHAPQTSHPAIQFIRDTLLHEGGDELRQRFAGKFQQLTAPATAKGIEDTAFYVYQRFIRLNEVGGDPSRFGVSADELHRYFQDRQAKWPYSLSPLSTHDTKRSEDVRARLNVISEMPDEATAKVRQWAEWNDRHKTPVDGRPAPDRNEEYLIYQTLFGVAPLDGDVSQPFVERIQAYVLKAMREAKVHTSWTSQNEAYEKAVQAFVAAILDPKRNGAFLDDFLTFTKRVSRFGLMNSLSQTLLRLSAPGVPDTYQGTESWDFSLVDPDNRRPVNYAVRQEAVNALQSRPPSAEGIAEMLRRPHDGRIKMLLTARALHARRDNPGLFSEGEYLPVRTEGSRADHVFAFARRKGDRAALVVAPRWFTQLAPNGEGLAVPAEAWGDTRLAIPVSSPLRNALTGALVQPSAAMSVGELLGGLPVGLFVSA